MKRIDERDTMFARMSWDKNNEAYKDYYRNNPDKKQRNISNQTIYKR